MKQEIIRIDLGGVNCYLLKSDNGFILVDTGGHLVLDKEFTDRCSLLEQALEKAGCNSHNLHLIILTHGDNDHVCNVSFVKDKYKAKIVMHKNDCHLVESPTIADYMNSFQYRSLVYKVVFKIMRGTIHKVAVKTIDDFKRFSPDILIDGDFQLSDYGFEGEILHIPGHTAGSIGILTKDDEFIAGDVFINIKKPEIAPNACDFKLLSDSVNKLKAHKINMVYPGHGEPFLFNNLIK
jgi:glyoxylase-like metal-dependent hydrolase (beta-lactamase superfamily II)